MNVQIISWELLSQYKNKYRLLILDLREYDVFCQSHYPEAIWCGPDYTLEKIPLMVTHYTNLYGKPADFIVLYCHSGKFSLLVAKNPSLQNLNIFSLYGGYSAFHSN